MDPYIKITKKFTKKFGSKVINRQYFHRKTRLKSYKNARLQQHQKVAGQVLQQYQCHSAYHHQKDFCKFLPLQAKHAK